MLAREQQGRFRRHLPRTSQTLLGRNLQGTRAYPGQVTYHFPEPDLHSRLKRVYQRDRRARSNDRPRRITESERWLGCTLGVVQRQVNQYMLFHEDVF